MENSNKHDYKYYHELMGDKDFLVFEEEGQVYVAQKFLKPYFYVNHKLLKLHCGIRVSYLKMPNRKAPSCFYYSDEGAKKLPSNSVKLVLHCEKDTCDHNDEVGMIKEACENAIDQLLDKKQLLEKTEVFKNFVPTLEKAKKTLNNALQGDNKKARLVVKIFNNLSYILSPIGQKDRVFEETIKQNALEKGMTAEFFLHAIGDWCVEPNLRRKTPYGQVRLTKHVYYKLRKMVDNGASISLGAMVKGITEWANEDEYPATPEEYLAKRSEIYSYLASDFSDLLEATAFKKPSSRKKFPWNCWCEDDFWSSFLRLTGENRSSPLPEKITAIEKLLRKAYSDVSLSGVYPVIILKNYYRRIEVLAPLGLNWPQKYEEFCDKNILQLFETVRENYPGIDLAKELIPGASFERKVKILYKLQTQVHDTNKLDLGCHYW